MIAASTVMRYHQGSEMSGERLCRGPGYDEKVIMTKGSVVRQGEEKCNKMPENQTKLGGSVSGINVPCPTNKIRVRKVEL